ncbi:MAG: hypothetical protein DWQ34_13045 [Planctomycetota bacterium]|nr:MAG: hypothetical protein DWQ34_13045 [Planctomycetota bacterium]REK25796.1 MAG: hypothetical protein DWQ41_11280 [Planctomycetota bacterium]REK35382.1 MAG: hypothetical protein DWQ45_11730 [Planctomycetota bacterium]
MRLRLSVPHSISCPIDHPHHREPAAGPGGTNLFFIFDHRPALLHRHRFPKRRNSPYSERRALGGKLASSDVRSEPATSAC